MSRPMEADLAGHSAEPSGEDQRPHRKGAKVADVRRYGQPPGLKDRRNEEHWAGRLYMRDVSPYFGWVALRLGFSPNQLTYLMMASGVLSASSCRCPRPSCGRRSAAPSSSRSTCCSTAWTARSPAT